MASGMKRGGSLAVRRRRAEWSGWRKAGDGSRAGRGGNGGARDGGKGEGREDVGDGNGVDLGDLGVVEDEGSKAAKWRERALAGWGASFKF
jgi:hypothetical protein